MVERYHLTYDLVVIGTGVAATTVATACRAAGWRVAVIDHRPFGGTCALRGCDPKKMLVSGAETFDRARRMHGNGVAGDLRIGWPELVAFKRSFTDPVPASREQQYVDAGIDAFHGLARFTGRNKLEVDGNDLESRHVLIAAGAEPVRLGIPGEEHLVTHEAFMTLDELPPRILLVGGGYIAAEFSHIAARAGARVTVLQRGDRMLKRFDPDLVAWLMQKFRDIGIDVHTNTAVEAIERTETGFSILTRSQGATERFQADLVVHAAGRAPAIDALDLAATGVETQDGRIRLDDHLRSVSNPTIYAAGDAANVGPPLTPVSSHDAEVVAANLLEGNRRKPDYRGVPSVAFTVPPIAAVGLSEAEARERGLAFRVQCRKTSDWFTARQAAEPVSGFKVLVEEKTGRILGAHLLGPHAEEMINLFALAIRHDLTAGQMKSTMFAYPTGASDIAYML
ncbi:NAD(P)/FAD-dependent oxidoreductase [Inquilinus limosus]|uniref:dihydrolipoyl dehydrogenase family protein n=1 Tax=Inquilinus limosus TaxID=171674 RepID=UPI003F13A70B